MRNGDLTYLELPGLDGGLFFVPLGGCGEIGMNLNLYGCDGRWLMVDCGVTFGDQSMPGVDVIMADPDFIVGHKDRLEGLIITHAHEDHLGAVGYLLPQLGCPIFTTPYTAEFLRQKLKETKLQNTAQITEVPLSGHVDLGPFSVDFISLTHSIPEPNALAIRTPYGTLLHTGDWKFDPDPLIGETANFEKLTALGNEGVLALVGDSTNVFSEGEAGSESEVRQSLRQLFSSCDGRIAVTCFASNLARLESIALAAEANGRQVFLVGPSLWRIIETARKTGYLSDKLSFHQPGKASTLERNRVLYICTGSQGEGRAALSRIALGQHRDVALEEGDVVVFSSRVIPGNEKAILKVQNLLARQGIDIVTNRDHFVHVSGHPARDEMQRMYQLVRPKIAIPVHGEHLHMRAHVELANACQVSKTVLVENGDVVRLAPDDSGVIGEVWAGRVAWDGGRVIPFWDSALKDRKRIFYNGSVVVSLVIDSGFQLASAPTVSILGLPDPTDGGEVNMEERVQRAFELLPRRTRAEDGSVEGAVRQCIRRLFIREQDRKPLTHVHIARI